MEDGLEGPSSGLGEVEGKKVGFEVRDGRAGNGGTGGTAWLDTISYGYKRGVFRRNYCAVIRYGTELGLRAKAAKVFVS